MLEKNWLKLATILWMCTCFAAFYLFFGNFYYIVFSENILSTPIEDIGLNSYRFQITFFFTQYFVSSFYILIALFIFWKKPNSWVVVFVSLLFLSYGTTEIIDFGRFEDPLYSFRFWVVNSLQALGEWLSLVIFFIFPNGRFEPRWTKSFSVAYAILVVIWLINPDLPLNTVHGFTFDKTPILSICFATLIHSTSLYALYYRYSNTSNADMQRQMKWIVYGLTIAFCATFLRYLILALFGSTGLFQFDSSLNLLLEWNAQQVQRVLLIIVPITFGIAILQDSLWDIDLIINRTLLYFGLSMTVSIIYVIIVGSLSTFFQSQGGNLLISLVGTFFIAVLFTPLKNIFDRSINRFLYGDRDNPYIVLSGLARQLGYNQEPLAAFIKVVNSIGQSLKLPYVAIALNNKQRNHNSEELDFEIVAEFGSRVNQFHSFPLEYQGNILGHLLVSSRSENQTFNSSEFKLLTDLALQTGLIANNYELMRDLIQAREKLVLTREEEKKRMRHELHDSLGPQLAILYTNLTSVKRHLNKSDSKVGDLIEDALLHTQHAKEEVRVLVNDLRPPNLDELGLVKLIEVFLQDFSNSGINFQFDYSKPFPAILAAAEVAIWRITQESVNNVVKHSKATQCHIHLYTQNNIHLSICDNGKGIIIDKKNTGVGLSSIRDRAEELGGSFSVETRVKGGTCLHVFLPLLQDLSH